MNCFRVHVLMAGHGDCLWIEYGPCTAPNRVLIDAGTHGTYERLKPVLGHGGSHELLVISHIDADHIAGALPLLDGEHARSFAEVWFNGRRHLQPSSELEELGAIQGEKLTLAIRKQKLPWNAKFHGSHIATDASGNPVQVSLDGGATITILSPGWDQLRALLPVWDQEVRKAGLEPGYAEQPPISAPPGLEVLGAIDIESLANEPFEQDGSAANGSSIAFLMEYEGKKVLFGADAYPSVLVESIRRLTGGAPLEVDVFKLPHHGSKANVSRDLIELVPAKQYVFSTNGAYHDHPDKQAVARVIRYGPRGAELVFNCKSEENQVWSSAALKKVWGYRTQYGQDDSGVSLDLLSTQLS